MPVLNDKVAVITGGSRGLGYAIAEAFAAAGASVVLGARSAATVEQAVHTLRARGYRASGLPTNVGRMEQVEALADHAVQTFGKLDVWVNNAGVSAPYGPTMGLAPAAFEQVVNTNILGTYYGSHAAMRRFLDRGSGKLINLLGRGWKGPVPWQNAYSASKAWVHSFTLALAEETKAQGASGVGVFAFNPGMVLTELLTNVEVVEGSEEQLKRFPAVVRMWAKPPEVPAAKAVWIASSATDGQTGKIYDILTPATMIRGAFREGMRALSRRQSTGSSDVDLKIRTVAKER